MSTCLEISLLVFAIPVVVLRDFFKKRRNKNRAMYPLAPPFVPRSDIRDEEPLPKEPLVERLKKEDVNLQLSSPLFNGRIPSEIRDHIFEYVLTEDDQILFQLDSHYSRPDYRARKSLLTNLLLTCRRVYLEAHHLPLINKEHVFWHYREPEGTGYENEAEYFARFRPDQLALVRKVHLFTQQFWLEGELQRVCKLWVMQTIEKMKITLRRGDWWYWEDGALLGINPQRGSADPRRMKADWKAEAKGAVIPWDENAWGCAFKHLRNLQELELEFETTVYEEKQLQDIVEHAKAWRFPMGDGRVLSAAGQKVHRSTWRGPMCVWSGRCPGCGEYRKNPICKICEERFYLTENQNGPMLVVLRLRWKLAAADTDR
jgi:hypothetical protein